MPSKPWTKMTAEELAKATSQFDVGPGPRAIKPPPGELAKHRRAMGKAKSARRKGIRRGRPPLGDGAARVLFTIEPGLLMRLDAFARKHHLKRSQLIAVSVESYMAAEHSGRVSEPLPPRALAS
jgi:hypothetical protein